LPVDAEDRARQTPASATAFPSALVQYIVPGSSFNAANYADLPIFPPNRSFSPNEV
jgi:hypothetical protein